MLGEKLGEASGKASGVRMLRSDGAPNKAGSTFQQSTGSNPFGGTPHQDPRLVRIFERWGFTWGGHWLVPDGMHFEFVRFAASV